MTIQKIITQACLILCIVSPALEATIGCMSKGYHAHRRQRLDSPCKPFDQKELRYVQCDCPCERYRYDVRQGRCVNCWHFRKPQALCDTSDMQPPIIIKGLGPIFYPVNAGTA